MALSVTTTHVGSLPRSPKLTELILAEERGELENSQLLATAVRKAVHSVVRRQKEAGISIPSDGEMSKISYATYIRHRLSGFEGDSPRRPPADLAAYPSYMEKIAKIGGTPSYRRPQCVGPIKVKNLEPLETDIRNMLEALKEQGYERGFMNSASPGVISLFQPSVYHNSYESYLFELAEAMKEEYKAIVASGLLLQIDAPDLALGRHMLYKDKSDDEFVKLAEMHLDALNYALEGLPPSSLRLHICWGNYEGPHHCDIAAARIMPLVVSKALPAQLLFEAANPRHEHEWRIWQDLPLREEQILIPGVIDSTTNFIEHPRLVADRIERYIGLVGAGRVQAGTDCGFSSFAGFGAVDAEIAYAKLAALVEGAALVS